MIAKWRKPEQDRCVRLFGITAAKIQNRTALAVAFVLIVVAGVVLLECLRRNALVGSFLGRVEREVEYVSTPGRLNQVEDRAREIDQALTKGKAVEIECPPAWIPTTDSRIVEFAKSNGIEILRFEISPPATSVDSAATKVCVWAKDAPRMREFIHSLTNGFSNR